MKYEEGERDLVMLQHKFVVEWNDGSRVSAVHLFLLWSSLLFLFLERECFSSCCSSNSSFPPSFEVSLGIEDRLLVRRSRSRLFSSFEDAFA